MQVVDSLISRATGSDGGCLADYVTLTLIPLLSVNAYAQSTEQDCYKKYKQKDQKIFDEWMKCIDECDKKQQEAFDQAKKTYGVACETSKKWFPPECDEWVKAQNKALKAYEECSKACKRKESDAQNKLDQEYQSCKATGSWPGEVTPSPPVSKKIVPPSPSVDTIIAKYKTGTGLDTKGLVNELRNLDLKTVKTVIEKVNWSDRDDVAYHYIKDMTATELSHLPFELVTVLSKSLDEGWTTSMEKHEMTKLVSDLDGRTEHFKPKNVWDKKPVYFVNGVLNTPEDFAYSAYLLAEKLGRPVTGIYNLSEGLTKDLMESERGRLYGYLTPAGETLYKQIKEDLRAGKDVELHVHSQGTIIASNALFTLQENDPDLFEKYKDLIKVYTYGGAAERFPDGPSYNHRAFALDPVSFVFGKTLSPSTSRVYSGGVTHGFESYMDRTATFTIHDHWSLTGLDEEGLAKDLQTKSPALVKDVINDLGNALGGVDRDDVAYHYTKGMTVERLKQLPPDLLQLLYESLDEGWITSAEETEKARISEARESKS